MTVLTGGEKSLYKMTKQEKETIIVFNEADSTAEIETYSIRLQNRLNALIPEYSKNIQRLSCDTDSCARYRVDKVLITIRKPYSEGRREFDRKRALTSAFNLSNPDRCPGWKYEN